MKYTNSFDGGFFVDAEAFHRAISTGQLDHMPRCQDMLNQYPRLVAQQPQKYADRYFISHRWDDQDDPDIKRWQLEALFQFTSELINIERIPACFWYDYTSLPQHPRTPDEDLLFKEGLEKIDFLCRTTINVPLISGLGKDINADIRQMLRRGWILVELIISQHNENVYLALFEGATDYISFGKVNRVNWQDTIPVILSQLPYYDPVLIRQWFDINGIACTNQADLDFVANLLYEHLSGHILKDYSKPNLTLSYNETGQFSSEEIATYYINKFGYSPFFPDVYFETKFMDGGRAYQVTARERPPLPPLNAWTRLDPVDFENYLIDPATNRSKLYPGIRFDCKKGSAFSEIMPAICTIDWDDT